MYSLQDPSNPLQPTLGLRSSVTWLSGDRHKAKERHEA